MPDSCAPEHGGNHSLAHGIQCTCTVEAACPTIRAGEAGKFPVLLRAWLLSSPLGGLLQSWGSQVLWLPRIPSGLAPCPPGLHDTQSHEKFGN